ncbi:MAG: ABC transporter ATP-binding protein [Gammaproteobacteria bacterium]|nr:ABC transporter ATP-binding protein [Gammaproteobacteria bacterium]
MLLDIRKLNVRFAMQGGTVHAVNGASLQVAHDDIVAVVGESGSGKSQTFLALTGLAGGNAEVRGEAWFESRNLLALSPKVMRGVRGRQIAYVFQDPMTALNPYLTIGKQLLEVIQADADSQRGSARQAVLDMLEAVRLREPAKRFSQYPHQLSGGQQQRVMLAMALLARPRLLIADEPTTALDVTVQRQVLDLLQQLQAELGFSLVLITHDLGVVARLARRVVVMYGGRVMEAASAEDFFAAPRHPYSRALLAAAPRLTGDLPRPIPGQPPRPTHSPPGCPFAARCPQVINTCQQPLPWQEVAPGHHVACHRVAEADAMEVEDD